MISQGKATLHELDTVYSLEDVYDMIEIGAVDAHNRLMIDQHDARQRERR